MRERFADSLGRILELGHFAISQNEVLFGTPPALAIAREQGEPNLFHPAWKSVRPSWFKKRGEVGGEKNVPQRLKRKVPKLQGASKRRVRLRNNKTKRSRKSSKS